MQRNPASRFMGGAWVFPGGAVDAADGDGERGLRAAGVREVEEEAGIAIADPASSCRTRAGSRRAEVTIRFDTWFFLAAAPADAEPRIDGGECVDWRWSTPQAALDAHAAGELLLVFPTIKHLEQLAAFRQRRRAARARARARGAAGRAARRARGRGRAGAAAGRSAGYDEASRMSTDAGSGLTVAVTGPTGDIGTRVRARAGAQPRRRARSRHGAAPVRPRRAGLAQDRVPAGRRARPRRGRRARRRAPTSSCTSRS